MNAVTSVFRRNLVVLVVTLFSTLFATGCPGDMDEDGVTVQDGDCDDEDRTIFPGALDLACDGIDQDCSGADRTDRDGDGVSGCEGAEPFDCDDEDATAFPGNTEQCDAVDHDCDGDPTNGLPAVTWWLDEDGDGFGAGELTVDCDEETPPSENHVSADDGAEEDCDDDAAEIFPGAVEVCDAIDNNCDEVVDEGFDSDEDGVTTCGEDGILGGDGAADDDCDDSDIDNFPGNSEVCDAADNDCDMVVDNGFDLDGDLVTTCGVDGVLGGDGAADDDCDDANPNNFPGNSEVCEGLDNDCDGVPDNGFDMDGDGVTICGVDGILGGDGAADDDCDDNNGANFPGNSEVCDAADNDCDTVVDNGFDLDTDGVTTCGGDGTAGTADDDCDDADIANFPGNAEVCDAADNDCDTVADNGFDVDTDGVTTCGADGTAGTADDDCDDADIANFPGNTEVCDAADNDCDTVADNGFDVDTDGVTTCGADGTAGTADDDCDDADIANFPGNAEVCDAADNDCDTVADNGFDADADGVTTCGADGTAGNADDDCNDSQITVFPGATEACDGVDTDCDGTVPTAEGDGDTDQYLSCTGFVDLGVGLVGGGDCDDGLAAVNPGATEVCDGIDNDCDTTTDEGFDGDLDSVTTCGPDGTPGNADDDCDDGNPAINPGATEICDLIDNDCDTLIDIADNNYVGSDQDGDGDGPISCGGQDCDDLDPTVNGDDLDFDGETSCDGDCDDANPTVNNSAAEACDGLDNDCDGGVDNSPVADADGDGFVASGCGLGGADCVDTDPHVFPEETYTSGWQKMCDPALQPGYGTSWAYGRLNTPSYFQDPQTGTHYLYFRGNHDPAFHQVGYATSSDGATWGDIQGPVLSESSDLGAWDGRRISHPTVAYIPGKSRPYIMAYHALDDSTSDRRVGIVTAETAEGDVADGTFKRQDLSGGGVSTFVIDYSANTSAIDNERVLNPSLWFDTSTSILHLWYTGRFGALNEFAIAHAQCDTTTSDCGSGSDWVKTDTSANGDPDVWLLGTEAWELKSNGGSDVQQTFVMEHSYPTNPFGYDVELWYTGAGLEIGSAQGEFDDASTWTKSAVNPVLGPSLDPDRMDSQSTTGRGVSYDGTADAYHMYYGASVVLPSDGAGEGTDPLWGPRNYSGGASYIGHAVNNAPVITVATSSCTLLTGDITDNAPDSVQIRVYENGVEVVSTFFGTATGNANIPVQTTTWSTPLLLSGGIHDLDVVATDAGGAERTASVSVNCPVVPS